jgi:hypothetical protein
MAARTLSLAALSGPASPPPRLPPPGDTLVVWKLDQFGRVKASDGLQCFLWHT